MPIDPINHADYAGHTPEWTQSRNGDELLVMGGLEEGPTFQSHDCGLPGPRQRIVASFFGIDPEGIANFNLGTAAPHLFRTCVALQDRVKRLEEALKKISACKYTCQPERYDGDNHGDSWENGYDTANFYNAEIARAALDEGGSK